MCKGTVNWEDVYIIHKDLIPKETLEKLNERWITNHGGIPVDACIGAEVESLIKNGIITVGSCCGHGKWGSHALALPSEKDKIESLGYTTKMLDSGLIKFKLRTGTRDTFIT